MHTAVSKIDALSFYILIQRLTCFYTRLPSIRHLFLAMNYSQNVSRSLELLRLSSLHWISNTAPGPLLQQKHLYDTCHPGAALAGKSRGEGGAGWRGESTNDGEAKSNNKKWKPPTLRSPHRRLGDAKSAREVVLSSQLSLPHRRSSTPLQTPPPALACVCHSWIHHAKVQSPQTFQFSTRYLYLISILPWL